MIIRAVSYYLLGNVGHRTTTRTPGRLLIDQEDGLKKLLTWFLNLVMQLESVEQINAESYQRIDSRKAHRNGYKERSLKTRVGELQLKKPQFPEISFRTKVFDRYSWVEKDLLNAIIESYLQRVSTRRVKDIVSRESEIYRLQAFPGFLNNSTKRFRNSLRDLSNIQFLIFL